MLQKYNCHEFITIMKMVNSTFRFTAVEYISDKRTVTVTLFEFIQTSNTMSIWWKMDSRHLIVYLSMEYVSRV